MPARRIVIAGGGFSGAAVAYHLLKRAGGDLGIDLIEPGASLGRGIAYGFESDVFRLNVPASKMSLDPEIPGDFVRFAGAESTPAAFLGRALYGRYVTERLESAIRASRADVRVWRDLAISATERDVTLAGGRTLPADALVLATGLTPRLRHTDAPADARVIDAWDEGALRALPSRGRVLLIGSGLSALDVLALLEARGFEGSITVVSRNGLFPLPHEEPFHPVPPLTPAEIASAPRELRALVAWVREIIGRAGQAPVPWQRAVDRLRPHVAALYRGLSERDRARFVRHVRPYWDVVRHRSPVDALARAEALRSRGKLVLCAGRARVVDGAAADVEVDIVERGGQRRRERFAAVVRCIGPALDAAEGGTPLVQSLLDRGLARVTSQGLGIETLADGRVVDARGNPSERVFGIGAVKRASHWETTSVPDIAEDARGMAGVLVGGG